MLAILLGALTSPLWIAWASTVFHVDVGVVVISFTVKDARGRYVSGLQPDQICIRDDGVEQKISSFVESTTQSESMNPDSRAAAPWMASSVFILFDTSNGMYEGFARAEDGIADFIRHLGPSQAVAVYSFSHNLTRLRRLTLDHEQAIRGLRNAAAGDSTAVLNATLLTIRDAA
jgi:Ca-activated chloride channel homolog